MHARAEPLQFGHVGGGWPCESVTMSDAVAMSAILAKPRLPILLESATTMTRSAARTSARLVCASTSWWVVKPGASG